ncbi:MAG: hypothetical protein ACYDEN_06795 [Acidimicrobiales bacterium]
MNSRAAIEGDPSLDGDPARDPKFRSHLGDPGVRLGRLRDLLS